MKWDMPAWVFALGLLGIATSQLIAQTNEKPFVIPFAARLAYLESADTETVKTQAEKGDSVAQFYLGICYQLGKGVLQDDSESLKWVRKAADQGLPQAQELLGDDYNFGLGVPQDRSEAVEWYRKAAEAGLGSAQWALSSMYTPTFGGTNASEAAKWCLKAAEQGLPLAQQDIAQDYEIGYGVPKDFKEAAKWYRKAAENTNEELRMPGLPSSSEIAQWKLGELYLSGEGVAQDRAEAVKWFRKAAERGYLNAEEDLALAYYNGRGVNQDYSEAAKWFRKAAEHEIPFSKLHGTPLSQFMLGLMYDNGEGVPQDYAVALQWYRKGANQGDAGCQNNLGLMYNKGKGVPQDYVEAYKWYNLAAAKGETNAIQNRDILVRSMTPDQIAEAQQLSREFTLGKKTPGTSSDNSASAESPTATGTGFFITDDGYLISNYHVVKDATKVRLLTSAGKVDAKVVSMDAANDLALLKADGTFPSLPISPSRTAQLGGTVATIGFPDIGLQGFAPKLAKGEIASLSGAADDPRYFQISVPVQPGNSGGALVDDRGNVIGIVSAKLNASAALAASGALPENVNYAVKSSLLLSFLESVPTVSAKLKAPNAKDEKFEDVVKSAQDAAVLVLVY
jgi:TPR repeat protein